MKPDPGHNPPSGANLARRLAAIYRRVVLTTVLLFAALTAIVLAQQYFNKRSQVMRYAADDLQDRSISVDAFLGNAAEDIIETKIWAENYLNAAGTDSDAGIPVPSAGNIIPIPPGSHPSGSFILPDAPGTVGNRELTRYYRMATGLLEIQRINHYAPPRFTWSEFRSLLGFVSVYPEVRPEMSRSMLARPVQTEMLARLAREDVGVTDEWEFKESIVWSDPYVDQSGKGLMITCASPVHEQGRLIGMVSAEMQLNFLQRFVNHPDTVGERIMIVDDKGQILAVTGMDPDAMAEVPRLSAVLEKDELRGLLDSSRAREPKMSRLGGNYFFATRLTKTGWAVVKVLPGDVFLRSFSPEAFFGGLMIALSFVFLVVVNRVINRYFVNPAVGFVEFIETEAVEGAAPRPEVPEVWRQWFGRISDTLALKAVAANLPGAVFQMKQDSRGEAVVTMVSSGVRALLGMAPEQATNKSLTEMDIIPADGAAAFREKTLASMKDLRPFAFETVAQAQEDQRRWVRFILNPRRTEIGEVVWDGLMLDISDRVAAEDELRRHRDHLEETIAQRTAELERLNAQLTREVADRTRSENALKVSEEKLRVMSQQMIASQDSERARLSRELHDEIGQQLAATLFQLALARGRELVRPEDIVRVEQMIRDAGEDLHRICRGLQPITLTQFGLGPALKMMLWEYIEIYGRPIEISIVPPDHPLSDEAATAVYRVCQEAVTNAVRHSGAENIAVALCDAGDGLILEIRDDGKGFDSEAVHAGAGLGLSGMRQRAEQCGAELRIETAPGRGTRVTLKLKVNETERNST